jgi:hypothetical protein
VGAGCEVVGLSEYIEDALLSGSGESMDLAASRYISVWFELQAFALIEQNQRQSPW